MPIDPEQSTQRPGYRKVLIAASIGSAFEIYDFTLFAFFAAAIAPAFFPATDPATSLLLTVATLGIGAIMRPVGALILGLYGDRIGRKAVLSFTFLTMAAGSAIVGITPKYETIGVAAPIIVLLARMAQGFSAGGEVGSASVFISEEVPSNRRGYYLGYISTATLGATLVSAALGLALNHALGKAAMADWGWRLPFLLGALVAPVGIYVRRQLPESHVFVEAKAKLKAKTGELPPPRVGLGRLLATMAGFVSGTSVNYITLIYMPTYLNHGMKVDLGTGFMGAMVASGLVAIISPIVGLWSDVYGRRKILIGSNILLMLLAYPLFLWLQAAPTFATIVTVQCIFAILLALIISPMTPLATEVFPTIGRSTGMSVAMALPLAIFGTCAPLIATWLIMATGDSLAPAFYLIFGGLIATVGISIVRPAPGRAL